MNIKPSVIFLNHNYRQKGDAISACHNSRNIMPQHNCHSRKSPYSYHVLLQRQLIFCRCPTKWKASFITENMNKHIVLSWYQHLDYQYAQSCMCQFLTGLNIWLKMCFAIQKIEDCTETTQANCKQNRSPFVVLVKFNNWIWVKKRKLLGGNSKSHVRFSYWQPFFFKRFKHSFKCCPGTLV